MPRAHVRPEDRQRCARACEPCRSAKKRCNGAEPCTGCIRKGIITQCIFSRRRMKGHAHGPVKKRKEGAEVVVLLEDKEEPMAPGTEKVVLDKEGLEERGVWMKPMGRDGSCDTACIEGETPAVMLISSSGEKLFVGNTASLSFLSLLQSIVKRYVGPSSFTDLQKDRQLLEVDVPEVPCGQFEHSLSDPEIDDLIDVYTQASCGLFDLFLPGELSILRSKTRPELPPTPTTTTTPASPFPNAPEDTASFYAVLAIGAQCRMAQPGDHALASRYFNHARALAFQGWLQEPTITLVRTFVLLAFYMLGACRRNAAFMYIGVASKAAIVLGLHADGGREMDPEERDQRTRIGMSVRVLDLVCSSILGRLGNSLPLSPANIRPTIPLDPSNHTHRFLALTASYEVCQVLEGIVREFTALGSLSVNSTDAHLKDLAEWTKRLPAPLRQTSIRKGWRRIPPGIKTARDAKAEAERKARVVGNINTASIYYFGVILVTRQYMIHHVMSKLEIANESHPPTPSSAMPDEPAVVLDPTTPDGWRVPYPGQVTLVKGYSDRCIDAALYLAQQCIAAYEAGDLLSIMCALKAWLFVSGLVLGFALLLERTADTEHWAAAFHGVRHILASMATISQQARQYTHILGSFSEAVAAFSVGAGESAAEGTQVQRILEMEHDEVDLTDTVESELWSAAETGLDGGPFVNYMADLGNILGPDHQMNPWARIPSQPDGEEFALPDVMALLDTFSRIGQT